MKTNWKEILILAMAGGLAVAGLGSSCPGTGSTANFTDPALGTSQPVAVASKSWTPAMLIDPGAINIMAPLKAQDLNTNVVNVGGTPQNSLFPSAVFHDSNTNFFAVFNAANANPMTASSSVYLYGTQQVDMTSSGWVYGLGSFTQLDDISTTVLTQHPIVTVDSFGNAMSAFIAQQFPGPNVWNSQTRPMASQHTFGNGQVWTRAAELSDITLIDTPGSVLNSVAINHDAYNDFVVVWVQTVNPVNNSTSGVQIGSAQQGSQVWFNEYRPGLGWRFHTSNVASASDVPFIPWQDQTNVGAGAQQVVSDLGVDVGFDSYGNGYGVYVALAPPTAPTCSCLSPPCAGVATIISARWRSDQPQNFPLTFNGGGGHTDYGVVSGCNNAAVFGYPRIWVAPDGSATTFWWQSFNNGIAQLWTSHAGATSSPLGPTGGWSPPARFDQGSGFANGAVRVQETGQNIIYSPIVAYDNTGPSGTGAVGFIKNDGRSDRFFVYRSLNNGSSWTPIGTPDVGGFGSNVTWGSLAINAAGQVAAAFTALDPVDFREHIYANFYSGGAWGNVTDISHDCPQALNGGCGISNINPDPAANQAFPVVTIDELGNACAVFSIRDNLFSPTSRRTAASFFH